MRKLLTFWIVFVAIIAVLTLNVIPTNAAVETVVVKLGPDFQKSLVLNATDGIYGNFIIQNGSADFQLLDPEGQTIFGCSHTDHGTINYIIPRSGNYILWFNASNSSDQAVLELTYQIRSWHTVAVWTITVETQGLPWWLLPLATLATIIVFVLLPLATNIMERLKERKVVLTKRSLRYKKPILPVSKRRK